MKGICIGINHVQLAAPKGAENKARGFFGNVLGMREIPKPEALRSRGGVWFECGRQQLHIGVESDFRPSKKAHPAFSVRNLKKLKERLLKNKIKVKEDRLLPETKRFYVEDPFGNRLEFLE